MSKEELEALIEIALRGASTVERAWINALVDRINKRQLEASPVPANGHEPESVPI